MSTGVPAFPLKIRVEAGAFDPIASQVVDSPRLHVFPGLSLRDYFAAVALPAIIEQNGHGECYAPEPAAKEAYAYADAMVKAREP